MRVGERACSQNRHRDGALEVDDWGVTDPAAVSEPGTAVTQAIPAVADPCSQCSAPLAPDQRYCLQCGTPRAHVRGPIGGAGVNGGSRASPPSSQPSAHTPPPGIPGGPPASPSGAAFGQVGGGSSRNNTLALLAGVGVLLLAMGIGVLIGRAGAGSSKAAPAQVISVGGAGGTSTTPTSTTPTETPTTEAKKKAPAKAKASSGAGSSINKPAPPSAVENLRSGSGESYEQKSKNLPNNVET